MSGLPQMHLDFNLKGENNVKHALITGAENCFQTGDVPSGSKENALAKVNLVRAFSVWVVAAIPGNCPPSKSGRTSIRHRSGSRG